MKATSCSPDWENIGIYSLQAGMTLRQLRSVLEATLGREPEREELERVRSCRRALRPKLSRAGYRLAS